MSEAMCSARNATDTIQLTCYVWHARHPNVPIALHTKTAQDVNGLCAVSAAAALSTYAIGPKQWIKIKLKANPHPRR